MVKYIISNSRAYTSYDLVLLMLVVITDKEIKVYFADVLTHNTTSLGHRAMY